MKSQATRTTCEFQYHPEVWPLVDGWAAEHGFILQSRDSTDRIYRNGRLLLFGPAMLKISQDRGRVVLQSWIKADLYMLMARLTGKPAEVEIASGGFTAFIPRLRARKAVNLLLAKFDQPGIG